MGEPIGFGQAGIAADETPVEPRGACAVDRGVVENDQLGHVAADADHGELAGVLPAYRLAVPDQPSFEAVAAQAQEGVVLRGAHEQHGSGEQRKHGARPEDQLLQRRQRFMEQHPQQHAAEDRRQ
ncbi:hypothetical protein D9M68_749080 [compost metagenome]